MISGNDIVIPAVGDAAALEACARMVRRHWRSARYEDAITGEKYGQLHEIPFGSVYELLAYPDAEAEAAWDADSAKSPENSMIYFIVLPDSVTAVIDNPYTAEMSSLLGTIQNMLWTELVYSYAEAA